MCQTKRSEQDLTFGLKVLSSMALNMSFQPCSSFRWGLLWDTQYRIH